MKLSRLACYSRPPKKLTGILSLFLKALDINTCIAFFMAYSDLSMTFEPIKQKHKNNGTYKLCQKKECIHYTTCPFL